MSVTKPTFVKHPSEKLDYVFNWSTALNGDTISSVAWTADPGITLSGQTNTTTSATVFVAGGTDGTTYELECAVTTAGGRILVAEAYIKVHDDI